MLTRDQQILIKRAQAQAGIDDAEYRYTLENLSQLPGCTSSKDPRLGDENLDVIMSYFEAIYWRRHGRGELPAPGPKSPFREPGYWRSKNTQGNTSRDRYAAHDIETEISQLEAEMAKLGCNHYYCQAIRRRVGGPFQYKAALVRTIKSKQAKIQQPL